MPILIMISFINCPFCFGHETVSSEAAALIEQAIHYELGERGSELSPKLIGELENIRNVILNTQERLEPVEEYTPPLCPTPAKRKYSNLAHAQPDAAQWRQHPYECACGYWHLSKQSTTEHTAKINSPAASADEFDAVDPLLL
jgi:hypothetical protein